MYHYAGNNPVRYIDPDGRIIDIIWDIGFTLYDIGSAINKSTKGDNSGWIDVGIDAAAMLIPCVPAGLSKIDDAVRVADKAGDIAKTEKKVSESAKTIKNARQSAVRKAWRQEQQMVLEKGYGTRNGLKVN